MTTFRTSSPPRVSIPEEVWNSGSLAPYIARLAVEHGPIFSFVPQAGEFAGQPAVYLVGPEANRFVLLSGRQHFSHDLGWTPVMGDSFGHGLLNMDPPEHTRHRGLMNPAFTASFMAGYLPLMERVIAQRTAGWAERAEVDLALEAREITFDVAAAALVGAQTGPQVDWLRKRFYILLHGPDPGSYRDWDDAMQQVIQVRQELQGALLELIDARRRTLSSPADQEDVLGLLVRARDAAGQALSDEQLLAHVNILLVAGHETTTTLGAWLLFLLGGQPTYVERIRTELQTVLGDRDAPLTTEALHTLPVLSAAIREAGRLKSPVLLLPRGVLTEFEFGGYRIPTGTPVFLAIAAGHHLPSVFPEPERFDPDRFLPPREEDKRNPYALVTFGGGPRICLGINFAQVEVTALAAHVLRRFKLNPIADRPFVELGGIIQSLPQGIPMRIQPLAR
ncbi:MAG TPA: cytochrome P450 [Chloroflexota bacterium]|nr:cytochrome P450 [Chloroflexota bacterium]